MILEKALENDCAFYYSFKEAVEDSQRHHDRFSVKGIYGREFQLLVAMVMTSSVFLMEGTRY